MVLVVPGCLWLFLVVVTFDLLLQVVVIAVKPHLYTEVLHKLAGEGRRWKLCAKQEEKSSFVLQKISNHIILLGNLALFGNDQEHLR